MIWMLSSTQPHCLSLLQPELNMVEADFFYNLIPAHGNVTARCDEYGAEPDKPDKTLEGYFNQGAVRGNDGVFGRFEVQLYNLI